MNNPLSSNHQKILSILKKHKRIPFDEKNLTELSQEEKQTLETWLSESEQNRELFNEIQNNQKEILALQSIREFSEEKILSRILNLPKETAGSENIGKMRKMEIKSPDLSINRKRRIFRAWTIAASIIIAFSIGILIYYSQNIQVRDNELPMAGKLNEGIQPGGNRATLTLSNGRTIELSDKKKGIQLGSEELTYTDGTEVLEKNENEDNNRVEVLTLRTPKGGQYQVILEDGTKIWLNAASQLTYPTRFTGHERKVELIGEGYFEIAHDKSKPFLISSFNQTIQVLGTHLNINSYGLDEATKVTLLEGSLRVWKGQTTNVILKPGEQAIFDKNSPGINVIKVNTEEVIAWKNGFFQFENEDIQNIMKQIERWYDVQISYEGKIPERKITGKINRDKPLSKVLDMLRFFNIQFQVQNKQITISSKQDH